LLIGSGAIGFGGWNIKERSTQHEFARSVPIRKQAVVADAMKAIRQHVKQEAAHELANGELHDLVLVVAILTIVLPAKTDMLVAEFEQPAVADGNAMGVARKIRQDLARACERALGENHPLSMPSVDLDSPFASSAGLRCRGPVVRAFPPYCPMGSLPYCPMGSCPMGSGLAFCLVGRDQATDISFARQWRIVM
jgi:hypothetical protein